MMGFARKKPRKKTKIPQKAYHRKAQKYQKSPELRKKEMKFEGLFFVKPKNISNLDVPRPGEVKMIPKASRCSGLTTKTTEAALAFVEGKQSQKGLVVLIDLEA